MKRLVWIGGGLIALLLLACAWLWWINFGDGVDVSGASATAPATNDPALLERGAYLARAGNCMACHTTRGGVAGAGGRAIPTPFGTLYTSNLTPDADTGIGQWNAATFWRALHYGRGADGRLLYPAFPYTHTTALTREDADALFAHFRSLKPVRTQVPDHDLRWPYGTQAALAVWRALYFKAGASPSLPAPGKNSPTIVRGAYLTYAVAHCSACHAPRDGWGGGDWQSLGGGLMASEGWYAPSLVSPREAGMADWPVDEIVALLRTGVAPHGQVSGPMTEVVTQGTQYLSEPDLRAMADYLKALPPTEGPAPTRDRPPVRTSAVVAGEKLYQQHCVDCHGAQGQGVRGAYPPLAGNRAVTMAQTDNLLQTLLYGGFAPDTAGHPRPFGMPPFTLVLSDREIAAVLTYLRASWGNGAPEVSALDVHRMRSRVASNLR
ncbi:cytochrome c [Ottowia sp. GY511]|uniref:C-type cytochrome n=1 Tax=Ottowia flava TaxID=2675430 RepID=A0ABW4KX11_9BURK|nr:cytochrome c [Ottowia sp. GY511]TXK24769.1 cytochrome c [Ottowia sp. GY511]